VSGTSVREGVSLESLVAEVADEFLARQRRGERPAVEEYTARHPQHAAVIAEVLAALRVVGLSGASGTLAAEAGPDGVSGPGELGDFRLLREVGRGGMGVVYEAEQVSLGRRVALKILPLAATFDGRQLQRFKNEAQAAAQLHHSNIVPVYSVGCERGVHYYAMQFIEGQSLAAVLDELRRQGAGPSAASRSARDREHFRTVARWGVQAAEALDHAHQVGVVHRDVKPANLLVDGAGDVWVTDFGLAQFGQGGGLTLTGDLVGTLRYMSPEQALARRVVIDHRTDVYSLGATLYELLTLRPAFPGADRQELLRQVAFEEPAAPRRLRRAVPRELETVVLKAMEKAPADRYATAQELADDLRRWLEDRPLRARRPGLARRAVKWSRRHRPLVAAAIVSLLLAVLMLAASNFVIWSEHGKTKEALRKARLHQAEVDVLAPQLAQLRRDSEAELERSLRALDRVLSALDEAPPGPEAERLRRAAAGPALEYYRGLRPPEGARHSLRWELMWAYLRQGNLHALRDEFAEAQRAYGQASAAAQGLLLMAGPPAEGGRPGGLFPADLPDRPEDERAFRRALAHWRQASPRGVGAVADYRLALAWPLPPRPQGVGAQRHLAPRPDFVYRQRMGLLERVLADLPTVPHRESLVSLYDQYAGDLAQAGRRPDALAVYRRAVECGERWRQDLPTDKTHVTLAVMLFRVGGELSQLKEPAAAERAFRAALGLREALTREEGGLVAADLLFAQARLALAVALCAQGPPGEGAEREAERLRDEAVVECRELLRRKAGQHQGAQLLLAQLLQERGELDEAVAGYRQALRIGRFCDAVYDDLGTALMDRGLLDEAVAAYREAIRRNARVPLYHSRLGLALQGQGRFREAVAEFRLGQPGAGDPTPPYAQEWAFVPDGGGPGSGPAGGPAWLGIVERLAEREARLPALAEGKAEPADATEQLALALVLHQDRQLFAAAARHYGVAFTAEPSLAGGPAAGYRYLAARAAALAGGGQGKDAAGLDGPRRAALRRQVLDWLRADLEGWRRLLGAGPEQARPAAARALRHWLRCRAFAGVRGPAALARLPEAERRDWQRLWEEIEALARQL
jgi:tetratricopeptide (TPR) repeat protein